MSTHYPILSSVARGDFLRLCIVCYLKIKKRSTFSGFSLPELLVVLSMLGILFGIAAPGWLSFLAAQELSTAQDQIFQALRVVQSDATRTRQAWEIYFREQNGVVQWMSRPVNSTSNNWQNLTVSKIKIDPTETTLPAVNGGYRVQFSHMGNINGQMGRITVVHNNGGKMRRCVITSTLLGAMRKASDRPTADATGRYCY